MKILFIGTNFGNSYLQYLALRKIHKNVDFINTLEILNLKKLVIYYLFILHL